MTAPSPVAGEVPCRRHRLQIQPWLEVLEEDEGGARKGGACVENPDLAHSWPDHAAAPLPPPVEELEEDEGGARKVGACVEKPDPDRAASIHRDHAAVILQDRRGGLELRRCDPMSLLSTPFIDNNDLFETGDKGGMSRDFINRIPEMRFRAARNCDQEAENSCCSVCLQDFGAQHLVRVLPQCQHIGSVWLLP
ncbi:hypothetical protein EJB05_29115, partial [Eragrostis curvula]